MSRECRYICQRAANAIISEIGPFRVSTDALIGINQFLDEFLIQLLTSSQSLDLSRIKTTVFTLLPATLGKNAIVEAELEVKTFTETEVIDYDVYEKMRLLGEQENIPFPLKECLPLLRDKCFEYCTLADKDDQQSWYPHPEPDHISISPIVAIYVTTVLEHMAEYILTIVAVAAENEDTDFVRIKELFLALIDDVQVGHAFHNMDLCEKMEKRVFPHGYQRYRPSLPPTSNPNLGINKNQPTIRNSASENGNFLDITFDDLDINYDDDDDHTQRFSGFSMHNSPSNLSFKGNQRPISLMTNSTTQPSLRTAASSNSLNNKKAYKVFKNDPSTISLVSEHYSTSSPVYDPDTPTMNFEDLIRSGNTMRVSLTPNRLKSIEVKDQMADDPVSEKPAWQRRSSSVPRMSSSSSRPPSRPQTPTSSSHRHHKPSPLVKNASHPMMPSMSNSSLDDSSLNTSSIITNTSFKSTKSKSYLSSSPKADHRFENPREAPKPPVPHSTSFTSTISTSSNTNSTPSSGSKVAEKTLPTPTSSTSSRQSKNRSPIPTDMKSTLDSSSKINNDKKISNDSKSTNTNTITNTNTNTNNNNNNNNNNSIESITPSSSPKPTHETIKTDTTSIKSTTTTKPISTRPPTLRRSSVSSKKSRENLRRLREKGEEEAVSAKSSIDLPRKTSSEMNRNNEKNVRRVGSTTSSLSSSSSNTSRKQQKLKNENNKKSAMNNDSSESIHSLSSTEITLTQEPESIQQNETEANNNKLERPSSIVAKRASGSARRQSLHESFAIDVNELVKEKNQPIPSSPSVTSLASVTAAGTVGNTIKQLDEAVKQKAPKQPIDVKRNNISKNIKEIENKNENNNNNDLQDTLSRSSSTSSLLAASRSPKSLSSSSLSLSSNTNTNNTNNNTNNNNHPSNNISRRSLVLDKVLQFERAYSVDEMTQKRSSTYIPRRERFMYLQRDPNALVERSATTSSTMNSHYVRPGTSASIAAAAARFAAGVSLGVQTDSVEEDKPISAPPSLIVTDESGHSKNGLSFINKKDKKGSSPIKTHSDESSDDSGSEHGVVEGDEEWFLPDDEWEDIQEQENAVAEWLLGEA